jgi:dihydropteroate synthase
MSTTAKPRTAPCRDLTFPRGRLALSQRVHVVGILNVTPDSFSDGGRYATAEAAAEEALRMRERGADVIDVGGESTRPGSEPVDPAAEIERVVPVIEAVRERSDVPISIDTRKADVARAALAAGADIVNDISALRDDVELGRVCAERDAPVILMHMQGTPRTMQVDPHYDDVVAEVREFLSAAVDRAVAAGVREDAIVLDPGIGFGKRLEDNLTLVNRLDRIVALGHPVMMAASRKSFLGLVLAGGDGAPLPVTEREAATVAVTALSIARGARLIRVHDVEANVRAARTTEALLAAGGDA